MRTPPGKYWKWNEKRQAWTYDPLDNPLMRVWVAAWFAAFVAFLVVLIVGMV